MPLVRIDVRDERPAEDLAVLGDAVHRALVEAIGIPELDRFQVITRHATGGLVFEHLRGDTAELNALAAMGGADVVAISAGAYPAVLDRYLLLPHGASVGRGFGPVVVGRL